jgi:hypothetical protein
LAASLTVIGVTSPSPDARTGFSAIKFSFM